MAYAVEEIASEEKTASPMVLGMRWWSASSVASGRPMRKRLSVDAMEAGPSLGRGRNGADCPGHAHDPAPDDGTERALTRS